jgi:hypothetical protein
MKEYIPTFSVGIVGTSTTIALGELNILAGILVAIVSMIIMIARYFDHRYKNKLEIMKLEEDLKILTQVNKTSEHFKKDD